MPFSLNDIPNLAGKVAVVTGATGGLGFETAQALAGEGANVIVAARNPKKGAEALAAIRGRHPAALVDFIPVDLASLASVKQFAATVAAKHRAIHILVNNAGVMAPPRRQTTADGFELQFGTNYLSHFALTARLLPQLIAGQARVVSLASVAARGARIHFDDLQATKRYIPFVTYGQSKLAMLMFAYELQRRSDAAGWGLTSIGAHPGVSRTDLMANGPGQAGIMRTPVARGVTNFFMNIFAQSVEDGALPQIFAATSPAAKAGGYYGPANMNEYKGPVTAAKPPPAALDTTAAARLWTVSQELTQLPFAVDRTVA